MCPTRSCRVKGTEVPSRLRLGQTPDMPPDPGGGVDREPSRGPLPPSSPLLLHVSPAPGSGSPVFSDLPLPTSPAGISARGCLPGAAPSRPRAPSPGPRTRVLARPAGPPRVCAPRALRWWPESGGRGRAGVRARGGGVGRLPPSVPPRRRGGRRGRRSAPLRQREGAARRRLRRPRRAGRGRGARRAESARGRRRLGGRGRARERRGARAAQAEPAARDMAQAGRAGEGGRREGRAGGRGEGPARLEEGPRAQVSPRAGGRRFREGCAPRVLSAPLAPGGTALARGWLWWPGSRCPGRVRPPPPGGFPPTPTGSPGRRDLRGCPAAAAPSHVPSASQDAPPVLPSALSGTRRSPRPQLSQETQISSWEGGVLRAHRPGTVPPHPPTDRAAERQVRGSEGGASSGVPWALPSPRRRRCGPVM